MRLIRILRILKVFRTKPELRCLLEGLVASVRSMGWVALMFSCTIYAAAIVCVSCFSDVESESRLTFQSVPEAMFTMFSVGLLADWTDIVVPVVEEYWWSSFFFAAFAFFTTIGMLNIIIGVITERTAHAQTVFMAEATLAEDRRRRQKVCEAADLIFGDDDDSYISLRELQVLMKNPEKSVHVSSVIGSIDFPLGYTVSDLHHMLDKDHSGSITREEFIDGISRLCFSNDFQRSCVMLSAISDVKAHTTRLLKEHIKPIQEDLKALMAEVKGTSGMQGQAPTKNQSISVSGVASSIERVPTHAKIVPAEFSPRPQPDEDVLCQFSERLSQFREDASLRSQSQSGSGHSGGELVRAVHDLWSHDMWSQDLVASHVDGAGARPPDEVGSRGEDGTSELEWEDSFRDAIQEYMQGGWHPNSSRARSRSPSPRAVSLAEAKAKRVSFHTLSGVSQAG